MQCRPFMCSFRCSAMLDGSAEVSRQCTPSTAAAQESGDDGKPSQPSMLQCPDALVHGCSSNLVALKCAHPNDCRYAPRHGQEAGLHLQQQHSVMLPRTALQRAAE